MAVFSVYLSDYGHPLVLVQPVKHPAVLTCELWEKWYRLYLVRGDETIHKVDYEELEEDASRLEVSAYVDHVPNPAVVEVFARRRGYELDECAFEMMVGRWELEVRRQCRG